MRLVELFDVSARKESISMVIYFFVILTVSNLKYHFKTD